MRTRSRYTSSRCPVTTCYGSNAEAKGIQLKANSLNNVREDVRKSVVDAVKLIHRFSKHARDDADETIDEAKIVPFADMTLLMVIRCMRSVFLRARAI